MFIPTRGRLNPNPLRAVVVACMSCGVPPVCSLAWARTAASRIVNV